MLCKADGTLDYPTTWPNCTRTIVCGQPPEPDVNVTRVWINGASENQETYDTRVRYKCQDGSQFDTDNDLVGDTQPVDTRCKWDKTWTYPVIPQCIVTHCVEPFKIPDETNLEEVTSDWTSINDDKHYRCKNQLDGVARMFWETDRSKSTFELPCNPDGYFTWKEWPICLEDITCSPDAPVIPTHSEYLLESDDGTVTINSLIYPTYPYEERFENIVFNSTYPNDLIDKNYMANLTYHCGSAREFLRQDGSHVETESFTCLWNKEWSMNPPVLSPCDWVACLKPPIPPKSTHLRNTDWFGDPIAFGGQIRYVCERGYFFEDDPAQVDVLYTCQDGSTAGLEDKRGFFDVPEKESDWPRCLLAPLCNKPPDAPDDGVREHWPMAIPLAPTEICALDSEDVQLLCHSFLSIYVDGVTYGRDSITGKELCGGDKPNDFQSLGSGTCYNETYNNQLKTELALECHGAYNCSYHIETVPLTSDCNGLRREVKIQYMCGRFQL